MKSNMVQFLKITTVIALLSNICVLANGQEEKTVGTTAMY